MTSGILLVLVYVAIGPWILRNEARVNERIFSSIHRASVFKDGIWRSYARNKKDRQIPEGIGPARYYLTSVARSLSGLMTTPGTLKGFHSDGLKSIGKVLGYALMSFWLLGWISGLSQLPGRHILAFYLYISVYFILTTVAGALLCATSRFRVPIMPYISILSAYGWEKISRRLR